MALQIKNNGPEDGDDEREYYGSSWQESTTAREPSESVEPEFNPEAEFDTFKVPKGVAREEKQYTTFMDPEYHKVESNKPEENSAKVYIKAIITLVVLTIIGFGIKTIFFPTPKDLTAAASLSKEDLAAKYKIKFKRDEAMDKYIPKWIKDSSVLEAETGKGLTVFSINGKYCGFHFDTKKYTAFGLSIGMLYDEIPSKMTFKYEDNLNVVNDALGGISTADYYYNETTNECLIITINDNTAKIAAITYTNNFDLFAENLSY